ncbi:MULTISPECIES: excalibur calcium-binding domain-containing protein [unclassified Brevundimonas]|uniref:excalibur calcium-binding domain-containing protein n=1 Tax=unclassified Brevundimonas TaxID=2622653 RepID=UPI0025C595EC|nr:MULTISPECIES: excalibur calcium-binding domain-containing protein [unclassified Brevundimonas]
MKRALIALSIMGLATPVMAHPGGLNAEGCHNDRRNGGYHCHRGPSRSSSTPPPAARGFVGSGAGVGTRTRYYANCSEARAAGAAPIRRGEPGYGAHLDRDNDGIACER